ncbi:MAG: hypothetical protein QM831_28955 [Kofleriaceae bacterium]
MRWFRALGPRIVLGISVLLALVATHMSVGKTRLPFVVMDALDRALTTLPQRAVPQLVAPQRDEPPVTPDPQPLAGLAPEFRFAVAQLTVDKLDRVLALIDGELAVAIDRASLALDMQLHTLAAITPNDRARALGITLNHLVDARTHLAHTSDPVEYAEYDALCERLRDVRRQLDDAWAHDRRPIA